MFVLEKYGARYTWDSIGKEHNIVLQYMGLVAKYKAKAQEFANAQYKVKESWT